MFSLFLSKNYSTFPGSNAPKSTVLYNDINNKDAVMHLDYSNCHNNLFH